MRLGVDTLSSTKAVTWRIVGVAVGPLASNSIIFKSFFDGLDFPVGRGMRVLALPKSRNQC
jgi:hypothetical protein